MLEILYKPCDKYPLGHLQTYDIQVAINDRNSNNVIKEDVAFVESAVGLYSLLYKLNDKVLPELEDILIAPVNHLNEYLDYLYENVFYVKLNGAILFNAEDLEGDTDETESNE